MSALDVGAVRSRLSARESFFGGALNTREQAKAPGWQAFAKAAPEPATQPKGGGKSGSGKGRGGSAGGSRQQQHQQRGPTPSDLEQERLKKLKQRRDFSGLDDDAAPPPPLIPRTGGAAGVSGGRQQQTAAGPPPRQQQQQQQHHQARMRSASPGLVSGSGQQQQRGHQKVTTKRAVKGGGGSKANAARAMAMEVTAVGKGRKAQASEALKQRVGEMMASHSPGSKAGARAGTTAAAALGSPTFSGTAGGGSAAAAAARAAREAASSKAVMQNKQYRTAHGMQTLQLVSRAPGQAGAAPRGGAAAAGASGGAALAAMRAGAAGSSPGAISSGQRPVTGAGASRRLQQHSPGQRGPGAGRGRPQFRGAFYGGQQPPAALEARMQYNKRRLSLDSGGDLDSFIASDEEDYDSDGDHGEQEDWRAALREATGGYDPSKFREIDKLGDRGMEAAYGDIEAEERRALRIARAEDEREAEREALREAAKRERKRAKKGAGAFIDMD